MSFSLPRYLAPDFTALGLDQAPDVKLVPAERDGVVPDGYHATTLFPEYYHLDGRWVLAEDSRMDCVAVARGGRIEIVEFRNVKAGDPVVVGRTEDGSEGIYIHPNCFQLLRHEREHGNILWVMGPACAFDADARAAFAALVRGGYVHGLMAGNALATHDLEASYLGTALGQDIYTQKPHYNGHYNHIDTINAVRRLGSISAFVESGAVTDGIMYECVRHQVPFALVGSVRDDGPLPEVYGDVYQGQDAMRELVRKATTIICMASTLHTVATGNMTPSYRVVDGEVRPLYFYSVDISEFAVNKLRDRGSLSVKTIVTNVQDFIVHVRKGVCPAEG